MDVVAQVVESIVVEQAAQDEAQSRLWNVLHSDLLGGCLRRQPQLVTGYQFQCFACNQRTRRCGMFRVLL